MRIGTEWIVDAAGCDPDRLRDCNLLEDLFNQLIRDVRLNPVKDILWHQFPSPGGITGMALLAESHITCHTYPEYGVATFNLYCCKVRPEWHWAPALKLSLRAADVKITVIHREVVNGGQADGCH